MISITMDAYQSIQQIESNGSSFPAGYKYNHGEGTNDFATCLPNNPSLLPSHFFDFDITATFSDMQSLLPERKLSHRIRREYVDHMGDDVEHYQLVKRKGHGVKVPFPVRLHQALDEIENDGHGDVISWQPHGRCFVVHKPNEFRQVIMPKYFNMFKFPSFLRQVNLYGFQRLTRKGADKGGYYHELFLRNKEDLAYAIPRLRIKGNGVRTKTNPALEPDFWKMPMAPANAAVTTTQTKDVVEQTPATLSSLPIRQIDSPIMYDVGDKDMSDYECTKGAFHCVADIMIEVPVMCKETLNNDELDTFLKHLNIAASTYGDITSNIETDFDYGTMMTRLVDM